MKKVVVLSGSIREGRKSHGVAKHLAGILVKHETIESHLLDLKAYPFPVMEIRMRSADDLPENLQEFSHTLANADGIIIVTPEYKNSIPGVLKNALDCMGPQIFKHKPIGITTVSSGGFGGISCLSTMRLVALAMGGLPVPEKLCVSKVNDVFDENDVLTDTSFHEKADQFITSFLWYIDRLSQ